MRSRLGPFAVLLVLLAGAAALRLWGLRYGFPHPSARPDEREVVMATRGFPAGDLNPHWFIYPTFYLYLVWAWTEGMLALQGLGGGVASYAELLDRALPRVILPGRLLSALAGVATVATTWVVGRRVGGLPTAALAAAIVATNPLDVRDSHALKPDTLLSLGFLLSLALLARWSARPSRAGAAAAGLAIGLTCDVKYNGVFLFASALQAHLLRAQAPPGRGRLRPDAGLVVLVATAVAVFVLGNPYAWLDTARFLDQTSFTLVAEYATRPGTEAHGGLMQALAAVLGSRAFGYHLAVSLWHGCGAAMALVTPLALAAAFVPPRRRLLVLAASFVIFYYLVLGASPVKLSRYFTPLVPLLALCVAALAARLAGRLPRSARGVALVGAALVLVAQPLASSVAHVRLMGRPDTRVLALQWMAAHLPPGAVVAVLGFPLPSYSDPVLPPTARRLEWTVPIERWGQAGVTYVVTHEHPVPFSRPDPLAMQRLAPHLRLLAEFSPFVDGPGGGFEDQDAYYVPLWGYGAVARGGPVVRVYAYTP